MTSAQSTSSWAKASLPARDGTATDAYVPENPNGQVELQRRDPAGAASGWDGGRVGPADGQLRWLKLVRRGDTFSGDGATAAGEEP